MIPLLEPPALAIRRRGRRRRLIRSRMLLLLAPVLLLLLRLSAVGFRLASLGGARDPHHGFALTPAPLAALVEGERGQAGARGTVRRRRRRRRPTMVLLLMMMVGEGGGRDDGRGGGGFHRGRVLRGECARLRSRTGGEGARWVSGGPDEGDGEGRRRRAFGRGRRKRARECRWDIPISGVDYVVEWADRGDRRRRGRDADCANGERVGAARVRTSEADLASLWGRDMTVTRAVPDIQNTEKDTGKESTGAMSGALSLPSVRPRAFGAGSGAVSSERDASPVARRRENLARVRRGR